MFAEDLEPIEEHVCNRIEVASEQEVPAPVEQVELEQEEIIEEVIPRSPKMDTNGKPIGKLRFDSIIDEKRWSI